MASNSEAVQKELRKSKSGLRILARVDSHSSPFLLDEPHWVPDNEVNNCQKCNKTFNFTNRKHHCRRCGQIFCGKDVSHKLPLPRLSFVDPVRLCQLCFGVTKKENEFFDKHLKTLTSGAAFNVVSTLHSDQNGEREFVCKLAPSSQRYIEFQGNSHFHDKIDITSIIKVQLLTSTLTQVTQWLLV
ncbi:ZFYVE21 [Bugula neritina]|uniref:ZFYVE21 n=1 Tax=Bugula neritina TaxID=10212 RepID=A0A7J7IUU7_BUGNE|nr:ZFYVE21 [Bugula neritina]